MLSPLFHSLSRHDRVTKWSAILIFKSTDDTSVVSRINGSIAKDAAALPILSSNIWEKIQGLIAQMFKLKNNFFPIRFFNKSALLHPPSWKCCHELYSQLYFTQLFISCTLLFMHHFILHYNIRTVLHYTIVFIIVSIISMYTVYSRSFIQTRNFIAPWCL